MAKSPMPSVRPQGFNALPWALRCFAALCVSAATGLVAMGGAPIQPLSPNSPGLGPALQLWYQADSLPLTNGSPVVLWRDSSGHGRDLSPTRGTRPGGDGAPPVYVAESGLNRRPAVRFDGTSGMASSPDNRVDIAGDGAMTLFLVGAFEASPPGSGPDVVFGIGDPANPGDPGQPRSFFLQWVRGAEPTLSFAGGWNYDARLRPESVRPLIGKPMIVSVVKTPGPMRAATRVFLNGVAQPISDGTDAVPAISHRGDIGAFLGHPLPWGGAFTGEVGDALIFNRALADNEREGVEVSLAARYSLVLPSMKVTTAAAFTGAQTSWWAFQPVTNPAPPTVTNAAWIRTPVDRFILATLESKGLQPSRPADRRTLLRRLAFDLTGLPPTPAELAEFLVDDSPDAFSRAVDRYLASERYGERWGRHWMDVVRYADTAGDNADYPVPEAHLYRDYIIDAFNRDMPYDQFVREQLAGDILAAQPGGAARRAELVVATGFLALSRRYATAPFEFMHLTIEDAIETTGRAFLGMTLRCARCHDHKYDPVAKEDYYGLYGFFASTRFPYAGSEEFESKKFARSGFVPLVGGAETAPAEAANQLRLEVLRAGMARLEKELAGAGTNAALKKQIEADLKPVRAELKRREKFGAAPGVPVAYAVADDLPVNQYIHLRGEPSDRGPVIPRCAPRFLGGGELPEIPPGTSGRLQFAEWLTRPDHPLTARVIVNRVWQQHFGRGLVPTPSNLGLRSEKPSHPELLDYLAAALVRNGWSLKSLHRLILNSAAWQQASIPEPSDTARVELGEAVDPADTLLWRFPRRRLDAESIRDSMMSVAGTLNLKRPGPHPFPPFEQWSWTQHNPFKAVYDSDHRSVFLMRQRLQRHPFLALFDAPDANVSTDVRTSATVPLQALYLMNNTFVRTQAGAFARRVLGQPGNESSRIRFAIESAWGRVPTEQEIARVRRFLAEVAAAVSTGDGAEEAWAGYACVLLTSNEFLYLD